MIVVCAMQLCTQVRHEKRTVKNVSSAWISQRNHELTLLKDSEINCNQPRQLDQITLKGNIGEKQKLGQGSSVVDHQRLMLAPKFSALESRNETTWFAELLSFNLAGNSITPRTTCNKLVVRNCNSTFNCDMWLMFLFNLVPFYPLHIRFFIAILFGLSEGASLFYQGAASAPCSQNLFSKNIFSVLSNV